MSNHGRRGTPHGSRVRVSASGQLEIDIKRLKAHLKARVPGMVQQRTNKGIDERGRYFKGYSQDYAKARLRSGRDIVPTLWLSGGMVSSYAFRSSRRIGEHTLALFFGPGAGTSPEIALNTLWHNENGKRVPGTGGTRTGRRSPPHNLLGYYHQIGAGSLPKRRWMGLTKEELATLAKEVEELRGVWVLRR